MSDAIDRLIRPTSIAVFGGSWAHSVVEQCQKMGFAGKLWPVHPTRESVAGLPCYPSIDALPGAPDASFLGVNREATIELVAHLSSIGAGGAVCFASGFSEAMEEDVDAEQLEQALLESAGDMPILGPNCYGFINCLDRALLWPDQHGALPVESGVAIVTQSSNIAINLTMQTRGLPIAYMFTAGNQAKVTLAQLAITALNDDRVTAIGLHIEGFGNIREFEQLALCAQRTGKRIIALKVGKTEAARHALKSHTSSLAGSDASADAFLARIGIARVHSLSVFIETLKLLHVSGGLQDRQMLSMSCSGGEACLMGDSALEHGLSYPALNDTQYSALRCALGPRVALANPLDYHTYIWNDHQAMQAMFAGMLKIKAGIAVLVLDFPRADRCTYDSWLVAIEAFKAAGHSWSGQLAVLASLPENMPEPIAIELIQAGLAPLCGLDDSMAAIAAAAPKSAYPPPKQASDESVEGFTSQTSGEAIDELASFENVLLPAHTLDNTQTDLAALSEAAAKRWLRTHSVLSPRGVMITKSGLNAVNSSDYLAKHCAGLTWPVVLKSMGSLHKSDAGGVVLGIENPQQLQTAVHAMKSETGFLVEEHVSNIVCELLVGIVRDPVHGFLMTVGAGGVQTELFSDTVSQLLPLTKTELHNMLASLRCYPLLNGYRGRAGCNLSSLLDALINIQQAAVSIADDLYELEINPLLCTEQATIAADALLRINAQSEHNREWT